MAGEFAKSKVRQLQLAKVGLRKKEGPVEFAPAAVDREAELAEEKRGVAELEQKVLSQLEQQQIQVIDTHTCELAKADRQGASGTADLCGKQGIICQPRKVCQHQLQEEAPLQWQGMHSPLIQGVWQVPQVLQGLPGHTVSPLHHRAHQQVGQPISRLRCYAQGCTE